MPSKKVQITTGNIYHILNRGVEKRDIFTNTSDYFRFISDLYEFNDKVAVLRDFRYLSRTGLDNIGDNVAIEIAPKRKQKRERELLVDILAFCLMPNHFHLLLRQVRDDGISLFMKKLGGYVMYFNKKYERVGPLFQNRYKAVEIQSDQQLITSFSYIHTNPVELSEPSWKTQGVRNFNDAKRQLNSWRWSSYLDYTGKRNFPSVTFKALFLELFGGEKGCEQAVEDWMRHKAQQYEDWKDIDLE